MSDTDFIRLKNFVESVSAAGQQRLPPEPRLSEQLGVTRGRLRTLLQRLESEGLIWRHVGKGTFVGTRQTVPPDEAWSASVSMDDWMDARLLLEPQLAAHAALHSTQADIGKLEDCFSAMQDASDYPSWKHLDDRLHRLVAEATHNMLLLSLYDALRLQGKVTLSERMQRVFGIEHGPRKAATDEHGALLAALRQHDPAAAEQTMRDHLNSVRQKLFGMR